jgi:hypothetical protein
LLGVLGGEKACRGPEGNRSRIRRRMSCRDKPFSGFTGKMRLTMVHGMWCDREHLSISCTYSLYR